MGTTPSHAYFQTIYRAKWTYSISSCSVHLRVCFSRIHLNLSQLSSKNSLMKGIMQWA
jgi:hypothetical protein